ncbi:MAG: hypothetical protein LH650_09910, partial [Chloroflexi bacterium]|nr:hypothetical protein [Chloroflexota bacterium]
MKDRLVLGPGRRSFALFAALALCSAVGYGALAADPSWTPEPTGTLGPSWPALGEDGPWPTPALLSQPP